MVNSNTGNGGRIRNTSNNEKGPMMAIYFPNSFEKLLSVHGNNG